MPRSAPPPSSTKDLSAIIFFVRRDLIERYRTDLLGVMWIFLQPLVFIVLFTTLFSSLMQSKLPGVQSGDGYTVYLVAGLLAWNTFSQSLGRISTWYRDHAYLYRKLPLGLLGPPASVVVSELVIYLTAMLIFVLFLSAVDYPLTPFWGWLFLPVGLMFTLAYVLGVALGLLEVFIPDIRRIVPIALQIGFWLTPIVYVPSVVPDRFQTVLAINPMHHLLAAIRSPIVFQASPSATGLLYVAAIATCVAIVMCWLHRRIGKVLRDAL